MRGARGVRTCEGLARARTPRRGDQGEGTREGRKWPGDQRAKILSSRVKGVIGDTQGGLQSVGLAGMDVLEQSERRAHNLLAAACPRAITMAYVELCEV